MSLTSGISTDLLESALFTDLDETVQPSREAIAPGVRPSETQNRPSNSEVALGTSPAAPTFGGSFPVSSNQSKETSVLQWNNDDGRQTTSETSFTSVSTSNSEIGKTTSASATAATPPNRGWLGRWPFYLQKDITNRDVVYYDLLTWKEKLDFRRRFLMKYFREAKDCVPFAGRLFMMIVRISPWRAFAVLVIYLVKGTMPARTLKMRMTFLMMVSIKSTGCF